MPDNGFEVLQKSLQKVMGDKEQFNAFYTNLTPQHQAVMRENLKREANKSVEGLKRFLTCFTLEQYEYDALVVNAAFDDYRIFRKECSVDEFVSFLNQQTTENCFAILKSSLLQGFVQSNVRAIVNHADFRRENFSPEILAKAISLFDPATFAEVLTAPASEDPLHPAVESQNFVPETYAALIDRASQPINHKEQAVPAVMAYC